MIGESIARLPSECLEDIKSRDDAVYAKETALHQALSDIKGKNYQDLVTDIDKLHEK